MLSDMSNDDIGYILPEPSLVFEQARLTCFSLISTFALMAYLFAIAPTSAKFTRRRAIFCNMFGAVTSSGLIIFSFTRLVSRPVVENSSADPLQGLFLALGMGVFIELILCLWQKRAEQSTRQVVPQKEEEAMDTEMPHPGAEQESFSQSNNDYCNHKRKVSNTFLITWRFSWYLLLLGSSCLLNGYTLIRRHQYEYLGPMRLTKLPTLHYSDMIHEYSDNLELFPCLLEHGDETSRQPWDPFPQPSVQVTFRIGWGKQWGCRTSIDQWNTNIPQMNKCTSFVCRQDGTSTCSCYPDESSARNASWKCVERAWDLTLLQQNATTYDPELPPWEDEFDSHWPTVTRYGTCNSDGKGYGYAMEVSYVHKVQRNATRQLQFGVGVLIVWCFVLAVLCRSCRQSATTTIRQRRHKQLEFIQNLIACIVACISAFFKGFFKDARRRQKQNKNSDKVRPLQ